MATNPNGSGAYLQGIGSAFAGQELTTAMTLTVDSATTMTGATATWEVLDLDGFVWSQGDCSEVISQLSPVNPSILQVTINSTITLPSNMVANQNGSRYQVRYTLSAGGQAFTAFEQFVVTPPVQTTIGPLDVVEVFAPEFNAKLVLPHQASDVTCSIWGGNGMITPPKPADNEMQVQGGLMYTTTFKASCDPRHLVMIEPYSLMWNYTNAYGEKCTETADLFFINPIMLDMCRQIQTLINRAYVDSGISPGTTFSTTDCLKSLRYAQDQFNAAGITTNFRLLNPQGQFRHFVVNLACIEAARTQALAEGMKSFNYGGQTVTLDVDRTQYWETMATNLDQAIREDLIHFKQQLARRGNIQGDMSYVGLRSIGQIGITIHAASPWRAGQVWSPIGQYNAINAWV